MRSPPDLRRPSSAATTRRDVPLLLLTLLAAFSSIASLLLHAAGILRMPFAVSFVTLPGMVLLLCVTMWAGRTDRTLLLNRIRVGFVAGVLGLIAYDLVRWFAQVALPLNYDAFRSMDAFGHFITGRPMGTALGLAAGWAYHVSNGLTFAIAYSVVAGPARWVWGLAWGTTLQVAMTIVYPGLLDPPSFRSFLAVSIIGHAVYGSVLGLWCERRAMPAMRGNRG